MDVESQHRKTVLRIPEFFQDKVLFITGGSGFLGKVLIEKLLRCCPGVKKIYMLIRGKKDKTGQERIDDMLKEKIFHKLTSNRPNFKEKIVAVGGDCFKEGLGISDEDRNALIENVNIVIHAAATIRFDEHIRIALQMNVLAVRKMIELCKEMKNLEVFCHISTAYSNCDKSFIEETIYPVSIDPQKILDSCEWMSDEMLTLLTPLLLKKYPNTYTFTKGLAEHIINEEAKSLPITIVRPGVISSCYQDPLPGWIDNYNGPTGIIAAAGKGILRTMRLHKEAVADIVPVDFVASTIITAVWNKAIYRPNELTVFNCISGNVNPMTWRFLGEYGQRVLLKYPFDEIFRRPNFSWSHNWLQHLYWHYISHRLPACVADTIFLLTGSKLRLNRVYDKIDKSIVILNPFFQRGWKWTEDNFQALSGFVPNEDKEDFHFDMATIDWYEYVELMILGVKQFLMNDELKNLPKARRQYQRYRIVRWLSCTVLFLLGCRFMFSRSTRFRWFWFQCVSGSYNTLKFLHLVNQKS